VVDNTDMVADAKAEALGDTLATRQAQAKVDTLAEK